ncbi:hypothetical protein GCN74_05220 [Janthinobacterium sp. FT14W]|uniref:50S ribosomal protein L11 methyltransferase n=1 Tax=Janthinobacterium sp. FT14W TaxID=2654253 RepID=UPI0012650ACE|nr:50S ribosomal protein L11 methyltransferase [Janthinobacterium sp. FT14W]KAB8061468.1 hypothetical protein GCN74_05220 [Janthinobacterium sp. FT14W]
MSDWSTNLSEALASRNPAHMLAMLAQVPSEFMHMATPYLEHVARDSVSQGQLELALMYYDQLIQANPGNIDWRAEQVQVLLALGRCGPALAAAEHISTMAPENPLGLVLQADARVAADQLPQALEALRGALQRAPGDAQIARRAELLGASLGQSDAPAQAQGMPAIVATPLAGFDPALLRDPAMPASFDTLRVEALRQHLKRHSAQVSPRRAMARLEDPLWLAAWDAALESTRGERVLLRGSELGVFALRALHHGAQHVLCAEAFPIDARIAGGIAQKHFLPRWHAKHGPALAGMSEEQRRASFDAFASAIDIVTLDGAKPPPAPCDCLVFPRIDHTLLGTGIVRAVREYCASSGMMPARLLPARATVYAMGIEWAYPDAPFALAAINRLRWNMAPQALELGPAFWQARTAQVHCGNIEFADFSETTWDIELPVTEDGCIDAIVFWFDLDLGSAQLSNAPSSALRCIKPAVQYTDSVAVRAGTAFKVRASVEENRLHFAPLTPPSARRAGTLPDWYVPMLGDGARNAAYAAALKAAMAEQPAALVLDIGAGCGLLSMMAIQAGAKQVIGCEHSTAIAAAGREAVALAGMEQQIAVLDKDCRKLSIPGDLPRRADLALFELFDCSLIGEGVLHFLAYAREHLLAQHARYLPAAGRIRAMLIEYRHERIWDIDTSLFNPFRSSPAFANVDAATLPHRVLSDAFDVFEFDFATAGPLAQERQCRPLTLLPGTVGAVLFWFDLRLDDKHWISNDPRTASTFHWKQGLKILPEVRVDSGTEMALVARHDGSGLDFHWNVEQLPKEGLSAVPRCDPRWLGASAELEQQTGGLLEHCARDHEEYAQVAQIAQRFAVDPGSHGLDQIIAQRFAAMFLD